jgi:parallel beta-helix repeat protein
MNKKSIVKLSLGILILMIIVVSLFFLIKNVERAKAAGSCSGEINCAAGNNNYTACGGCSQCNWNFMNCGGNFDCTFWNNNQSGCEGTPSYSTYCKWNDEGKTCTNPSGNDCSSFNETYCIALSPAGCDVDGDCQNAGGASCDSCGTSGDCNACSFASCSWEEATVDNPPSVSLNLPGTGTTDYDRNVTFNCSATDDQQLVNLTIYVWNSSTLYYNNTVAISGTSNSSTWALTSMPDENYKWNCLAYDNASNSSWAANNFTLAVQLITSVTNCTVISSAGRYALQNNIDNSPSTTCINITAASVILNGNGYIIDGLDTPGSRGIYVDKRANITIQNITLTNWDTGIYFDTVVDSRVQNVAIDSSNIFGIDFESSLNNNLTSNSFSDNHEDIYLKSSTGNKFINQTFGSTTTSFTCNGDFKLMGVTDIPSDPSNYHNISKYVNITISGLPSSSEWLYLNVSYSHSDLGSVNESNLSMWRYNGATWNLVSGSGVNTNANYVYGNLTQFSIFAPLGQEEGGGGGDSSPSVTLNSPGDGSTDTDGNITFICTAHDDINLVNVTLYGNWSGSWVSNGTNSSPANNSPVTFDRTFGNGSYLWNCRACDNASQCAFAAANRTVKVSVGGGGAGTISSCGYINAENCTDGWNCTLSANVWNYSTCFIINVSNIVFNCQGNTVYYANESIGYAFKIFSQNNVTVKNCKIEHGIYPNYYQNSPAIYLRNVSNNNITNNNITTRNSGSYAIYFEIFDINNTIQNNVLNTTGDTNPSILFETDCNCNNNSFINNTIMTSGTSSHGFDLRSSTGLIVQGNNITANQLATGIKSDTITNSNFINNYIAMNGAGSGEVSSAFDFESSQNNNLTNNDIVMGGAISGYSTIKMISSNNTIFNDNEITTSSTGDPKTKIFYINSSISNIFNRTSLSTYTGTRIFEFRGNVNSNQVFNSIVSNSADDFAFNASSGIVNFTNVTFNKSGVSFASSSTARLFVKWYVDVYVNNTKGEGVDQATVWMNNTRNTTVMVDNWINITNSTGDVPRQIAIEYMQNSTKVYNLTPDNFSATKNIISNSSLWNITTNTLNVYITLDIDSTPPNVSIVSPANGSYTQYTYVLVNSSINDSQTNISSCVLEWQNSTGAYNISMIKANSGLNVYCNYNKTGLSEGNYTFKVYANDTWNNTGVSGSRIVYVDLTNPIASQGTSPVDSVVVRANTTIFDLKCSDNMHLDTLQLWGNFTGTWNANQTNSSPINDSWWNKTVNNGNDGTFGWSVFCNDSSGRTNWTTNRTLIVDQLNATVTLNSPKNDTYTHNSSVLFNCSASDLNGIANITLYGNFNSTWLSNGTNTTSGTNATATFSRTLSEGNYLWNCYACETTGDCAFASSNYTLIIDTTLPVPYFVPLTPDNGGSTNKPFVYVNVSVNDTNKGSAFIDWNQSLRGYWAFEENSGTNCYDNSTWGNIGTMTNMNSGTDNGTSGRILTGRNGRGMMFDGTNDYINCSNSPSVNITQNITLEMWVKLRELDRSSDLISKHQLVQSGYSLRVGNDNKFYFMLSNGTWDYDIETNSVATANKWYHVVGVWNSTYLMIYLNGVLEGTQSFTGPLSPYNGNLMLGRYSDASVYYFNGIIDEVRIWSKALSAQEINSSYNNGLYRLENNFTGLSSANYNYTAFATDRAGNINKTETRTVTIETVSPNITFISPTPNNASYINVNYTTINVNVTDSQSNISSCILEWNGINESMNNIINYNKGAYCNITKTDLSEGTKTFKVYANDSASNMGNSSTRTLYIDLTDPIVSQGLPADNTSLTNLTLNFSLKCSDNMHIDTLQLWGNWTGIWRANQINSSPINDSWWNISVKMPSDGAYKWAAWCNDSSGRSNMTGNRTFTIDTQNPQVYLNEPANNFNNYGLGASLVSTEFNCSATDSSGLKNITLYGNWTNWSAKNSSSISGTSNSSKWYNNLNETRYIYTCQACDNFSNCAYNNSNFTFRVRTNPSVIFEEPSPDDGGYERSNVTINTTITDWNLASASLDFDSSLRGYWAFNEENGTIIYDNSTFENTGILSGPTRVAGKFANGLQFDGSNDYVNISNSNSLNPSNAITIEAWFKTSSSGVLLSKRISTAGYMLQLYQSGSNYSLLFRKDSDTITTNANYNDNQWHHVAVTYDSTLDSSDNVIFYLDGIIMMPDTGLTGSITSSSAPLLIGRDAGGSPSWFVGTIDEVKIHSRALTASEINASYNNGLYRLYSTLNNLADESQHNFSVIASDQDGNMNRTETKTFIVDITAPIITIISPENITYNPTSVWANVSLNEPGSWCRYSRDDGSNVTMTELNETFFYKLMTNLSEGQHNIIFYCSDIAGNIGQSNYVYFTINDAPTIYFVSPTDPDNSFVSRNYTYINTSIEDNDNISSCILEWDGNNETMNINTTHYNETGGSIGITTLQLDYIFDIADVYANDSKGNSSFQIKWILSSLPPNITISQAMLCVYWQNIKGTPDADANYSRVDDTRWDERITPSQWNAQKLTNTTLGNWSSVTQATFGCLNVTNAIKTDYEMNNNYSSLRIQDPDYLLWDAVAIEPRTGGLLVGSKSSLSTENYLLGEDREGSQHAPPGSRPYLNITYATVGQFEAKANCYLNKTGGIGTHTYTSYANDTFGKLGISETRVITFGDIVTECENFTVPNSFKVLINNVSSNGTCYRILADNVTLDCGNYKINYSIRDIGNAVYSNSSNSVIQNCLIMQSNVSAGSSHGIHIIANANSSNITDNIFNVSSTGAAAISLDSYYNLISGNQISNTAYGILIGGSNNTIEDNDIIDNVYGVYANKNADDNIIKYNTFYYNDVGISIRHDTIGNLLQENNHYNSVVSASYDSLLSPLEISSSLEPATAPNGYLALDKYINISTTDNGKVDLKMHYSDEDFNNSGIAESSLTIWKSNHEWMTPPHSDVVCGQEGGYEAENTRDDNLGTYWAHLTEEQHSITYRFDESHNISAIRIYTNISLDGAPCGTKVELSPDGGSWTEVADEDFSLSGLRWHEIEFNHTEAQYIKLTLRTWNGSLCVNNYNLSYFYEFDALAGEWTPLTSYVNDTGNYVESNLTDYSIYGVFGFESVDSPENFSIYLTNESYLYYNTTSNVKLNWSQVSDADGYYIYYSDNVTEILDLDEFSDRTPNETITGSSNTEWTDTDASEVQKRFYALASYKGSGGSQVRAFAYDRLGKFDIEIPYSENIPGENEGVLISVPLTPNTENIDELLNLSSTHLDDIIVIYDDISGVWQQAENLGNGSWHFSNNQIFEFEPGRGYWFTKVAEAYNFSNVGKIPRGNLAINIPYSENIPGENEGVLLGWTLLTSNDLNNELNLSSSHLDDIIVIYNNTSGAWQQAENLGNGSWHFSNNQIFEFEPGRGYWFTKVAEAYDWTQQRPE